MGLNGALLVVQQDVLRTDVCSIALPFTTYYGCTAGQSRVGWSASYANPSGAAGQNLDLVVTAKDFGVPEKTAVPGVWTKVLVELPTANWAESAVYSGTGLSKVVATTATAGTLDLYARNVTDADSVYFPTWQDPGQTGLQWYQATHLGGGVWKAAINLANHPGYAAIHTDMWEFQTGGSFGYGPITTYRYKSAVAAANPGFESGSLAGWNQYQVTHAATTAEHRSGSWALEQTAATAVPHGTTWQDVPGLLPGKSYRLKAWVKASPGTTAQAWLWVHDGSNASPINVTSPAIVPGSSWAPLTLNFTANNTANMRVHLMRDTGAGTVYWDDVEIAPELINNGFEDSTASATGWVGPYWIGTTGGVTQSEHFTGISSVAVGSAEGGFYQDIYDGVNIGQVYRVSAWVKGSPGSQARLWVHDNGGPSHPSTDLATNGSWQRIWLDFTSTTGNLRVHLHRVPVGTGNIYWDDVTVGDPN